jgi:hypothetical protein
MPVFLIRFGCYAVSYTDSLSVGTPGLHPPYALDDVDQLATGVGVPVIPNTRLEPNHRGSRRERRRRLQERARARLARKVGRLHGLEIT